MNSPLLSQDTNGHFYGKCPEDALEELNEIPGHVPTPIMKVIRSKCLDCVGYSEAEVRKCVATDCALWPYRMGKNPFLSKKAKERAKRHKPSWIDKN